MRKCRAYSLAVWMMQSIYCSAGLQSSCLQAGSRSAFPTRANGAGYITPASAYARLQQRHPYSQAFMQPSDQFTWKEADENCAAHTHIATGTIGRNIVLSVVASLPTQVPNHHPSSSNLCSPFFLQRQHIHDACIAHRSTLHYSRNENIVFLVHRFSVFEQLPTRRTVECVSAKKCGCLCFTSLSDPTTTMKTMNDDFNAAWEVVCNVLSLS